MRDPASKKASKLYLRIVLCPTYTAMQLKMITDRTAEAKTNKSFAKLTQHHQEPTGGKTTPTSKLPPDQNVGLQVLCAFSVGFDFNLTIPCDINGIL